MLRWLHRRPVSARPTLGPSGRRQRASRRGFCALLLALCWGFSPLGACDSAPTLPLPPPVAAIAAPNSAGLVTVEGKAKNLAIVYLYNDDTENGVIGRADEGGLFVLAIAARTGDTLTLWQESEGQTGQLRSLLVPAP